MTKPKTLKCIGGSLDGKRWEDIGPILIHTLLDPPVDGPPNNIHTTSPRLETETYYRTLFGFGAYKDYIWLHESLTGHKAFKRLLTHYRPNDRKHSNGHPGNKVRRRN